MEIVRRAYDAFVRGDTTQAFADIDAGCVATRVAPMPDITPYYGPEGLVQMLADWLEGFDDFEMVPGEYVDANDKQVLLRMHQRALGAQSGVPIKADFWFVNTMQNLKIVRIDIYGSASQALKAVGLDG